RRMTDQVVLTVSDQGRGFDPQALLDPKRREGKSYGLFNIRERLQLIGGAFDLSSSPSGGTSITLTAPLQSSLFETACPARPAAVPRRRRRTDKQPEPALPGARKRVMLVDDHAVVRQGLSSALSRSDDIDIVGEAADGKQAVDMALELAPDVILMDVSMPVMDGIEATRQIHAKLPRTRIIGLSMHDAEDQAQIMADAGAAAFLNKSSSLDIILSAIRRDR
ncbi:MAG: response regulator, partial [Desulfosarcinaceae bacterium]